MICFGYLGSQPGPSQFFYAFWCAPRGPVRTLRGARHRWRGFHDSSVQSPRCEAFERPSPERTCTRVGLAVATRLTSREKRACSLDPTGGVANRPSRTHVVPRCDGDDRARARGFPSPRRPCAATVASASSRAAGARRDRAVTPGPAGRTECGWRWRPACGADRRAVTPRARIHGGDAEAFEAVARARLRRARSRAFALGAARVVLRLHRHLGLRRAARCPSRRRAPIGAAPLVARDRHRGADGRR